MPQEEGLSLCFLNTAINPSQRPPNSLVLDPGCTLVLRLSESQCQGHTLEVLHWSEMGPGLQYFLIFAVDPNVQPRSRNSELITTIS